MALWLQHILVGLAVVASAVFIWRTRFTASWRAFQSALAMPLLREGRPTWQRSLGRLLAPPGPVGAGRCGGCEGCG